MRFAEMATAAAIMALSVFFMAHAVALPIGWDPASGPGGGMFPFWLSAGLFVCGAVTFVRQWRLVEAPGQRRHPFFHRLASGHLALTVAAMLAATALLPVLGAYIVLPAFLIGYTRVLGRMAWPNAVALGVGAALAMFFFFEVTLKTLLPKGVTEPLFIPLYAIFF